MKRPLAELLDSKLYCVATVNTNRREFPKFSKSRVKALERGQHIAKQVIAFKVHCFVRMDKKAIGFVDTICDSSDTSTVVHKLGDGSTTRVNCPSAVAL